MLRTLILQKTICRKRIQLAMLVANISKECIKNHIIEAITSINNSIKNKLIWLLHTSIYFVKIL